jgi:hypothetical protein
MPLDPETMRLLQQAVQQPEDRLNYGADLAGLSTLEVVAWMIETVRKAGGSPDDEATVAGLLLGGFDRLSLREYSTTLGKLGYQAVALRLKEVSKERKRLAKPPRYWPERLPRRLAPRHLQAMN